jgi:hypothetical protein
MDVGGIFFLVETQAIQHCCVLDCVVKRRPVPDWQSVVKVYVINTESNN